MHTISAKQVEEEDVDFKNGSVALLSLSFHHLAQFVFLVEVSWSRIVMPQFIIVHCLFRYNVVCRFKVYHVGLIDATCLTACMCMYEHHANTQKVLLEHEVLVIKCRLVKIREEGSPILQLIFRWYNSLWYA